MADLVGTIGHSNLIFNLILSIQFTNIIESNIYYKKYLGTVRRWLGIQLKSVSLQH